MSIEEYVKLYGQPTLVNDQGTSPPPTIDKPGFFQDFVQDIKETGSALKKTFTGAQRDIANVDIAQEEGQGGAESRFQRFGRRAGGISEAIGDIVTGAGKAVLPQGAEEAIQSGFEKVVTPIAQSDPVQTIFERYQSLDEKDRRNVDAALGIGSLMFDFATISPAGKVGAKVGETAVRGAEKVAEAPIKIAAKAGERVASEGLGFTTGAGREVIEQAFRSEDPLFKEALRGTLPKTEIVDNFKSALGKVAERRADNYKAALKDIEKQTGSLDISPVHGTLERQLKDFNIVRDENGVLDFSRSTISDPTEVKRVEGLIETLNEWGLKEGDRTPVGLDLLKRRLSDFQTESGQARKLVNEVKTKVTGILNDQVPGYREMTKGYAEASQFMEEIERSLGLGGRTGMETTINKITASLSQNKEYRSALIKELEEVGNTTLKGQVAGASLNSWVPRGLATKLFAGGAIGTGTTTLGSVLFGVAAALPFFSPRIVGELLLGLGLSQRKLRPAIQAIKGIMEKLGKEAGRAVGAGAAAETGAAINPEE